jgi:hypothetical protein
METHFKGNRISGVKCEPGAHDKRPHHNTPSSVGVDSPVFDHQYLKNHVRNAGLTFVDDVELDDREM